MRTRRLIVVTLEGERELLFIGRLTVGRAPECDISLADTKISRRHAEFDASGSMPRVTDLGSRNGILVNGRKVGAADLAPGDIVTVGDARIRFDERVAEVPQPVVASASTDDRTAVLAPMQMPVPGAMPPPPPPMARPVGTAPQTSLPVEPAEASGDADRTGILPLRPPPPGTAEAAPPPAPVGMGDGLNDRTIVLPPPDRAPGHASRPVAAVTTARLDRAPLAPAPPPPLVMDAPPPAKPLAAPARVSPAPVTAQAAASSSAPVATPPATAAHPMASATGSALTGPRFSWSGLVTLAAVLLGGLAVLLGALPLMSASSSALDALSQRQARTLAGWLAAGVDRQAPVVVDTAVMEAVLAQPGVARAMVLERATGRAVAPASVQNRSFSALPGVGEGWRDLQSARVGRVDAFADAYVPAGDGAYVVWVRYERPSSDDTGLAIMVALVATLVFAMLIALLIKRHTKATLQHFTRQVELAVSGASPKVMQGTLMPGLDRLPGVVTYLLEQRRAGSGGAAAYAAGLQDTGDSASGPAAPIDLGPPWLEVTPSLMVAQTSPHGPPTGAPDWPDAQGRHLLDVLDNGPVRNAVVQGLGALGMPSGSETTVPLPDAAPIALRREASGHVRVTLGAR